MSRFLIVVRSNADRLRASQLLTKCPIGTRIEFKASKRTLPQNDLFWSRLGEIARQLPWHGVKLTPDDWRLLFLNALKRELRIVPNLDGTGFVTLSRSSDLSKEEFSGLLELIAEFGARHGIKFGDEEHAAA